MTRYRFARLYLFLLTVLSGVCAAAGIVGLAAGAYVALARADEIRLEKFRPVPFDTARMVARMYKACEAVKDVSPGFSPAVFPAGGIPIGEAEELRYAQMVELRKMAGDYEILVGQLKEEYLASFDRNIELLEKAALDRLNAPGMAVKPIAQTPGGRETVRLYDRSAMSPDALEELQTASQFLDEGVRYYSPSEGARAAAAAANRNLLAAIGWYEKEYRELGFREWKKTSEEPRVPRPQEEMIGEFLSNLSNIRQTVEKSLSQGWAVEQSIEEAEALTGTYLARIGEMKEQRNRQVAGAMRSALLLLGGSLVLMVIRDFLRAAIDLALNTRVIRDTLAGAPPSTPLS